jgi:hypothetical protein
MDRKILGLLLPFAMLVGVVEATPITGKDFNGNRLVLFDGRYVRADFALAELKKR